MKKVEKKLAITLTIIFILLGILLYLPYYITNPIVDRHIDYGEYSWEEYAINIEKLNLRTEDGVEIVAYENYVKGSKGTIVMISGIHNPSVRAFFNHVELLEENKFSTILLETRAHGESEGNLIGLGYLEVLDVKAVVNYIKEKNPSEKIIVWGYSMGGSIAINSIGQISHIDALISMSAFSSWEQVLADNITNMGVPRIIANITKPFTKFYTWRKYGFDKRQNIASIQIRKLGDRPALLVHSKEDSQVPFASYEKLIKNGPKHIDTWILEGDKHMILDKWNLKLEENEGYIDRVMGFLNNNF